MYKDPDKQREAQRDWVRQKRKGSTKQGSTVIPCESHVDASDVGAVKTLHRLVQAKQDKAIEKATLSEGVTPNLGQAGTPDLGQAGTEGYIGAVPGTPPILEPKVKRGKDIKVFADLPAHVQQTIDIMSDDKTEHKRRTAIAINYQHLFPDRFHSTGVI